MMIYPPIAELVKKTGSRYILVIEAARRARQLSAGAEPLCDCDSNKEVSIATNEIYQDKLRIYMKSPSATVSASSASVPEEGTVMPGNTEPETASADTAESIFQPAEPTENL